MATWTTNPKFFPEVKRRMALALKAVVLQLVANIKALLTQASGGTGRRYDWYKGHLWPMGSMRFFTRGGVVHPMPLPEGGWKVMGRIHQSSAPGQSPRLLTGALALGVSWRMGLELGADPVAQVGPSGPSRRYARRLEEDMNRPAWGITLRKSWPMLEEIFAERLARA